MSYTLIGILALISLVGCVPDEIEVKGTVDVNFLLKEALEVMAPFAEVGIRLPLDMPDSEELYCEGTKCITAGDARDAAKFMLKTVVVPVQ